MSRQLVRLVRANHHNNRSFNVMSALPCWSEALLSLHSEQITRDLPSGVAGFVENSGGVVGVVTNWAMIGLARPGG